MFMEVWQIILRTMKLLYQIFLSLIGVLYLLNSNNANIVNFFQILYKKRIDYLYLLDSIDVTNSDEYIV